MYCLRTLTLFVCYCSLVRSARYMSKEEVKMTFRGDEVVAFGAGGGAGAGGAGRGAFVRVGGTRYTRQSDLRRARAQANRQARNATDGRTRRGAQRRRAALDRAMEQLRSLRSGG